MVGGLVHGRWVGVWLVASSQQLYSDFQPAFHALNDVFWLGGLMIVVENCLSFPMAPISAQKDFYNLRYSKNIAPTLGHIGRMCFQIQTNLQLHNHAENNIY